MADSGADKPPAVTGTLEEKTNNGDQDEIRRADGAHSPLNDASRGLLPEAAEEEEEEGTGRPRGHSNSDSDSSAVDSDEEEVCVCVCVRAGFPLVQLVYLVLSVLGLQ